MLAGLGYRKLNYEYFMMLNKENMELVGRISLPHSIVFNLGCY